MLRGSLAVLLVQLARAPRTHHETSSKHKIPPVPRNSLLFKRKAKFPKGGGNKSGVLPENEFSFKGKVELVFRQKVGRITKLGGQNGTTRAKNEARRKRSS